MASKELNVKVKHRYDTASNWTTNNPVLLAGEFGIESDTNKMKVGDGTKNWSSLEYIFKDNSADKMDKVNPTGSGSFSLNRKEGSEIGIDSTAIGTSCVASGNASHAEGNNSSATSSWAHAEGSGSNATGTASHAEGNGSDANGYGSHAECGGTANGMNSHAEGTYSEANGSHSHAEGFFTKSDGDYSSSKGFRTSAKGRAQFVFGELNVSETPTPSADARGKYVEIVGNGYLDGTTANRSNARTLDWEGNQWLAGNLQAAGLTDGTTTKSMTEVLAGGGGIKLRRWTD